jgi:hypothetical protein
MLASKLDETFVSLPLAAKIWIFAWSYLAVSGWFSTYVLVGKMNEAWGNEMFESILNGNVFALIVSVMFLSSMIVIGLLFYGRYNRKRKDVMKAALVKYEKTGKYEDAGIHENAGIKFDLTILPFWIGGSVLNTLFSLCILIAASEYYADVFAAPVIYIMSGFAISFFSAVLVYLVVQVMANGVLDAKAVKKFMITVAGSPNTRNIVGIVCERLSISDRDTVERIYDRVKDRIKAKEYSELTPDEVFLISETVLKTKGKEENVNEGSMNVS